MSQRDQSSLRWVGEVISGSEAFVCLREDPQQPTNEVYSSQLYVRWYGRADSEPLWITATRVVWEDFEAPTSIYNLLFSHL